MKRLTLQVVLCMAILQLVTALDNIKLGKGLDIVFLSQNISAEDFYPILANARESYMTLKAYNETMTNEEEVLNRLQKTVLQITEDLTKEDMNISQIFENLKSYLTGTVNLPNVSATNMAEAVRVVMDEIHEKLRRHYATSKRNPFDIESILSANDSQVKWLFRDGYKIDASTVGYFFLEAFATLIGLTWGLITMIIPP